MSVSFRVLGVKSAWSCASECGVCVGCEEAAYDPALFLNLASSRAVYLGMLLGAPLGTKVQRWRGKDLKEKVDDLLARGFVDHGTASYEDGPMYHVGTPAGYYLGKLIQLRAMAVLAGDLGIITAE